MTTALLVVDMQVEMADRIAGGRLPVIPEALAHMAQLAQLFRARGQEVVHVHHHDNDAASPFRRGTPSGAPMQGTAPQGDEAVFWKSGSSAFVGTGLDAYLRRKGVDLIVVIGAVAAFCVTSTVRAASDLGFKVILPSDALLGFDLPAHDGGRIDAQTVHLVTLSLLGADFAKVVTAREVEALTST
jgi:nicotinamidase-related amidase